MKDGKWVNYSVRFFLQGLTGALRCYTYLKATYPNDKYRIAKGKVRKKPDLREELAQWVRKNISEELVDEALKKYDTLVVGGTIGGLFETMVFLGIIEQAKAESDM